MTYDEEHRAAVAKVRALLGDGASVVDVSRALGGAFMFALMDAIPIGLITARTITIEVRRSPERYAHVHLRELEHLARVFAFESRHGFLDSYLTDAILERHRSIIFTPGNRGGLEYRYGEGNATGRSSGSMESIRAQVEAAMRDAQWDGELRILVDEPARLEVEFSRVA